LREVTLEATVLDTEALAGEAKAGAGWWPVFAEAANGPTEALQAAPQPHILWVGDERMFGRSISRYLSDNRLRVTSVPDGEAMLMALNTAVVDVVVLALPPGPEGGALLAPRLREQSPVPIIMLSTQREEADRIMALELGADDCLTAPFSPRELLARVRAILRRRRIDLRQRKAHGVRAYRFGGWELNLNTRRLRSAGKREIALSNGEFSLLGALLAAGGRTLSRMQLLELSRLHDDEVYDRAVDMQVMRLRRKLEADCAEPRYLATVRGAGYRIGVPVEPVY
jgi:DNA-binding response OmpR family regulator